MYKKKEGKKKSCDIEDLVETHTCFVAEWGTSIARTFVRVLYVPKQTSRMRTQSETVDSGSVCLSVQKIKHGGLHVTFVTTIVMCAARW